MSALWWLAISNAFLAVANVAWAFKYERLRHRLYQELLSNPRVRVGTTDLPLPGRN